MCRWLFTCYCGRRLPRRCDRIKAFTFRGEHNAAAGLELLVGLVWPSSHRAFQPVDGVGHDLAIAFGLDQQNTWFHTNRLIDAVVAYFLADGYFAELQVLPIFQRQFRDKQLYLRRRSFFDGVGVISKCLFEDFQRARQVFELG